MKKKNCLLLWMMAFVICACESGLDEKITDNSSGVSGYLATNVSTRAETTMQPLISVGDHMGIFVKYGGSIQGPDKYTISSVTDYELKFFEDFYFDNPYEEHTFYGYIPYEASTSKNPERVSVLPVPAKQTQNGTSYNHLVESYIVSPVTAYEGERINLVLTPMYSYLEFQIRSIMNDVVVKSIKVNAPDKEVIAFGSGKVNVTKSGSDPAFMRISEMKDESSVIELNVEDELKVPVHGSASAYMTILPFAGEGKTLTITVETNKGIYTFEKQAANYVKGYTYAVDIELGKQREVRDIRVLSVCEVGCLGEYDNTKKWNCNYGATVHSIHSKELRRLLFEHFGKGKTVESGKISFEKTDVNCFLNKMTPAQLERYDIIYLNYNARPNEATAARIMNWLNGASNRVLMLAYDWKDSCVRPSTARPYNHHTTNYVLFRDYINGVKPHWYNSVCSNASIGNYGIKRQHILVPFELNERTSYFWKEGPFKTNLSSSSTLHYWIEDYLWGVAEVTDPNVIPLITYRHALADDGRCKTHLRGSGDGGMILGVDPTKRIVYIGDSEIFSVEGACTTTRKAARITFDRCGNLNNYGKVMGNLWAWMLDITYSN